MKLLFDKLDRVLASKPALASLCLRAGLTTVFIYAAISSFLDPQDWIGYLPPLLTDIFPGEKLLIFFSIAELMLAAWLLSGVYVRLAALLAALMLAGIVVSNYSLLPISFRDIGLMFAALALAFMKE